LAPQAQQALKRKETQVIHRKTQTPASSQERIETPQTQKTPPHTEGKQNKQVDNKQNKQADNKQNKQARPTPPPASQKTTNTPMRSPNHRTPSSTPAYPSRSTRPNHPTPQPNTKPPQPPPEAPKHQKVVEDNDEALYSLQELRDTLEQELLKKSVQERLWEASRFVMGIETDEQASETLIQESIDALKRRPSAKEQIESDKQCRALRTASTQQTLREIWSQLYNERHQFTPHIRCELWKAKEWRKRELNRLQPHSF
tara:strand:+ start:3967 stop:4737 length:771 start_codon:yes stop_codon:yes gene_type:complete